VTWRTESANPRPKECKAGGAAMAKHEHGKMDISEQEKTFEGFIKWSVWVGVVSIAILIFLALVNS
jgi:hypothetical protein